MPAGIVLPGGGIFNSAAQEQTEAELKRLSVGQLPKTGAWWLTNGHPNGGGILGVPTATTWKITPIEIDSWTRITEARCLVYTGSATHVIRAGLYRFNARNSSLDIVPGTDVEFDGASSDFVSVTLPAPVELFPSVRVYFLCVGVTDGTTLTTYCVGGLNTGALPVVVATKAAADKLPANFAASSLSLSSSDLCPIITYLTNDAIRIY